MTTSELIKILREVDPKSRVVFLAGVLHTEVAEEIVAVATPEWVWVRGSNSKKCEDETQHASEQEVDSGARRESFESESVSVVILSTDDDLLFKAIVKKLMLG